MKLKNLAFSLIAALPIIGGATEVFDHMEVEDLFFIDHGSVGLVVKGGKTWDLSKHIEGGARIGGAVMLTHRAPISLIAEGFVSPVVKGRVKPELAVLAAYDLGARYVGYGIKPSISIRTDENKSLRVGCVIDPFTGNVPAITFGVGIKY